MKENFHVISFPARSWSLVALYRSNPSGSPSAFPGLGLCREEVRFGCHSEESDFPLTTPNESLSSGKPTPQGHMALMAVVDVDAGVVVVWNGRQVLDLCR